MYDLNTPRTVLSFYKYCDINNPKSLRESLYTMLSRLGIFGRIYIAREGINAQIAVPNHNIEKFKSEIIKLVSLFKDLYINSAICNTGMPFVKLTIKVKNRIVFDGIKDKSFSLNRKGNYLTAIEVNNMINNHEVLILDIRNKYEYMIGRLDRAIVMPHNTFRDQLTSAVKVLKGCENKKIVMYCTGGIRCEKGTAWMMHNGFNNVNQIYGGILTYVRTARKQKIPMYFKGKLFVFDARLSETVTEDVLSNCYQCGISCNDYKNCRNDKCHMLFLQCKYCAVMYNGCCSESCVFHVKTNE